MPKIYMLPRWCVLSIVIILSIWIYPLIVFAQENYSGIAEKYTLPSWMRDKILAGYLYDYNDAGYISQIKSSGLNTLIIKSWKFDNGSLSDTLNRLEKWGKVCKQNDIHAFLAYNWQPQDLEIGKYRRAVFSDGSAARFICPLDNLFWEDHLIRVARIISNISKNNGALIDSVLIDMEMYGTEDLTNKKRFYSQDTCYCDICFDNFLKVKGITTEKSATIVANKRYEYLINKNFIDEYRRFQVNKVQVNASNFREVIEQINPRLFISIYPYPNKENWVLNTLVKTFGTVHKPVLLFAVDTYYSGGYERIPEAYGSEFRDSGIDALYIAGYLLRKYSANAIHENIVKSGEKADGYWLYRLPQLMDQENQKMELFRGTADDYWGSVKEANDKHRMNMFEIRTLKIVK